MTTTTENPRPAPARDARMHQCRCGNLATIPVSWGNGVVFYCDACDPEKPRTD